MSKNSKTLLSVVFGVSVLVWLINLSASHGTSGHDSAHGASAPPRKQLHLSYGFSEGWLISHDFYLTNASGENLSEVKLHITFIGEDNSPSVDRYWANWSLGNKQHITVPVDEVKNVQRINVVGRATEGDINEVLEPKYQ